MRVKRRTILNIREDTEILIEITVINRNELAADDEEDPEEIDERILKEIEPDNT